MDPRIVLIGAGSSEFGYNSILDATNLETLHGCNLVLHDINTWRLETMGALAKKMVEEVGYEMELLHKGIHLRVLPL